MFDIQLRLGPLADKVLQENTFPKRYITPLDQRKTKEGLTAHSFFAEDGQFFQGIGPCLGNVAWPPESADYFDDVMEKNMISSPLPAPEL